MGEKKPDWAKQLAESPFREQHFTRILKNKVLTRTREVRHRRFKKILAASLISATCLLIFLLIEKKEIEPSFLTSLFSASSSSMKENTAAYMKDGSLLFSVAPEPGAKAGEMNGYIFHFEAPLQTFYGKTMEIDAVHIKTGIKQMVSIDHIQEPSSGYPGLERYGIRFALPIDGMWELHVSLDGNLYGSVNLDMQSPSWDVAPQFRTSNYWLRGIENRVGFIDAGFVAGKAQKYMWHFWGTEEQLNGPFEVRAVKEGSETLITVFASNPLSSANALGGTLNGADRSLPTSMMLPESGRWRLLPYVRGILLDPIVVEVK